MLQFFTAAIILLYAVTERRAVQNQRITLTPEFLFSNQCIHEFTSLNLITVHTKNDKNAIYIRHNVKAFSGWIDDILHSILIHGMGLLKLV